MDAPRPIFQDEAGNAVKFFIQKDLPQDIQQRLQEDIVASGGRVHSKVPIAGYVLTAPGTEEDQRLRYCWKRPERPERYFVPHTFVDACKTANKLVPQLFLEQGEPMPFHLHSSILNVNMREVIAERIRHSGGDPDASLESARVILADPGDEDFKQLIKQYESDPDKYIEAFYWVQRCVELGAIHFTPVVYKNPGGRRAGDERTNFTEEDERHLCEWMALKIPYKESGGRTGNKVYQQLCAMENNPQYEWVKRHTWQSWRERYKKHGHRLDRMIESIVEQRKPMLGEKGQYHYVRLDEAKDASPPRPKRKRKRTQQREQSEATQNEQHIEGPVLLSPPNAPVLIQRPPRSQSAAPPPVSGSPSPQPAAVLPPSQPKPKAKPKVPQSPPVPVQPSQENDDGEESQWPIRIGNDPPPVWARKAARANRIDDDDDDDELAGEQSPAKRPRIGEAAPSTTVSPTPEPARHGSGPTDGPEPMTQQLPPATQQFELNTQHSELTTQQWVADSQDLGVKNGQDSALIDSQQSVSETEGIGALDSQDIGALDSQNSGAIDSQQSGTIDSQNSAVILANIHGTDRTLRDIAKSFRFTYEEVREYHEKCRDTNRVRMRFQEMRTLLRERFNDM
ncbi:hypothetical protein BD626DRAFT_627782 [Schizophyllum amplum]|uniref:DNA-binding protein RAP1 n=1 Tax=Schizophyllum amplum TaxID=97359 RepID=A0A550CLX9_9AGAR|nr:hypothetical protein BD626DRAFT_627782 [Auriculariopsis ampla]